MGLLALLAEGPSYGYEMKAAFEARTGGVWRLNVGQVYTTLERLRADDLVEPIDATHGPSGRDRRRWRITRSGKEALDAWFDAASVDPTPPRDELLAKVLFALARSPREALAVIDRHRAELYALAHHERADARRTGHADLAFVLMTEAVASRREAELRWLDRCEELVLAECNEGTT